MKTLNTEIIFTLLPNICKNDNALLPE